MKKITDKNKLKIIDLVKKGTKLSHSFESIEIDIVETEGRRPYISYVAKVKDGNNYIPLFGEKLVEVNFKNNIIIVSASISSFKRFS